MTDKLTKKADVAYQKKEFGNAATLYHLAADQKPGDATISYNLGIAEFKAGNYDNSITAFDRSTNTTRDKTLKSKALYNLGIVFLKKRKLKDAILTFKKSLILNPLDNDCRQNLQMATNELKKDTENNKTGDNDSDPKESDRDQQHKEAINKQSGEQILEDLQKEEQRIKDSLGRKKSPVKKTTIKDW